MGLSGISRSRPPLPCSNTQHHALTVDVADFQLARLTAAQAGAVERQQQCAVIEILRACDQALDLLGTEDDRRAEPLFRIRQVLAHVAPLQNMPTEEPERADLGDDGAHRELPLFQEEQVIASELGRRDPIKARARVLTERVNDLDVAADGRGRRSRDETVRRVGLAVAGSQTPPVTGPLLLYEFAGCPSAAAPAASFKSPRVYPTAALLRIRPQWWAHLVGALRVYPHEHWAD